MTSARGIASTKLDLLAKDASERGAMTLEDICEGMGSSSLAFTILILAVPALTPIPGPFGFVFGSCLALVALQIMGGARRVRLPAFLASRPMPSRVIETAVRIALPWVQRIERVLKPGRLTALTGRKARILIGLPVFLLAVAVALPIPFGNILPVLALILIAIALIERDGLMVLIALTATTIALGATGGLIYASSAAITAWLG